VPAQLPRPSRVLFVTRELLHEGEYGSGAYVLALLRQFEANHWPVEIVLLAPMPASEHLWQAVPAAYARLAKLAVYRGFRVGSTAVQVTSLKAWALRALRRLNSRLPRAIRQALRSWRSSARVLSPGDNRLSTWHARATPDEVSFVRMRWTSFRPDVVIANYAWLSQVLTSAPGLPPSLTMLLTHDLVHQRVADYRRLGLASDHDGWTAGTESASLRQAEVLLAIQELDAERLRAMAPEREVICVPMPAHSRRSRVRQEPGRCLFVGSQADHNVLGLRWFIEQVWPLLQAQAPWAKLYVCGAVCRAFQHATPGIIWRDVLDDLGDEYGAAQVCLLPLLTGSGLKIKLVEALGYGRTVVSTGYGLQGVEWLVGQAALLAETPAAFAAAVTRVLTDGELRQRLEAGACLHAATSLAPETTFRSLIQRVQRHADPALASQTAAP